MEISNEISIAKLPDPSIAFIYSSWLKAYKFSSAFARQIPDRIFFQRHHAVVERILEAPTTSVYVASPTGDPATYLGYLVVQKAGELTILHFCYVKSPFRRMGIMTALLAAAGVDPDHSVYTHRTYDLEWLENRYPGLTYDPYLI